MKIAFIFVFTFFATVFSLPQKSNPAKTPEKVPERVDEVDGNVFSKVKKPSNTPAKNRSFIKIKPSGSIEVETPCAEKQMNEVVEETKSIAGSAETVYVSNGKDRKCSFNWKKETLSDDEKDELSKQKKQPNTAVTPSNTVTPPTPPAPSKSTREKEHTTSNEAGKHK